MALIYVFVVITCKFKTAVLNARHISGGIMTSKVTNDL